MHATLPIVSAEIARAANRDAARGLALDGPLVDGGDLLAALLREQQDLSAVERFSQRHADATAPAQERYYRALLPATPPGPGQQYGFEVDLDRCSGCKACVAACHSLNGLDDGEAFRDVGLLHGGSPELPVLQHVTTACHHCLKPACLSACPVDAYEKDPATGIVRHLDDQCIGCQYCTLACPYDVPKFHKKKGIVRKCDLCAGRLAAGEAPACVQACPHEAIRVRLVDADRVADEAEANAFLPGAPDPDYTLPTTTFLGGKAAARNLLPADYYAVRPEHAHWPLVVMLVLTQLSVGAFVVELGLHAAGAAGPFRSALHPLVSLAFGLLALGASTLHLGRPHLAFRAMIGLRHSWLSREAAAFGAFAPLAVLYAGLSWLEPTWLSDRPALRDALAAAVCGTGLAGVLAGVMVYHVVRRVFWHGARTAVKFLGTSAVLGLAAALLTSLVAAALEGDAVGETFDRLGRPLCVGLVAATAAKLLYEAGVFAHLRSTQFTPLRRTALLMTGDLAAATKLRFALGAVGGVLIPSLMLANGGSAAPATLVAAAAAAFPALLGGELAERYLFFTAVVRQKMPGGLTV